MERITWENEKGRKFLVELPEGVDRSEAEMGIFIGPPDIMDSLGLPEDLGTRLHNILFDKKLFTNADVKKRPKALFGVLQQALKVDAQRLHEAFVNYEQELD